MYQLDNYKKATYGFIYVITFIFSISWNWECTNA